MKISQLKSIVKEAIEKASFPHLSYTKLLARVTR